MTLQYYKVDPNYKKEYSFICPNNPWVMCSVKNCYRCGWNPNLMEVLGKALVVVDKDEAPTEAHGWWNEINQTATGLPWKYRCSECGCPQDYTHNYCPNCGAKMEGCGNA